LTGMAAERSIRIATFNVNGINGRLPRLLEWLREAETDVACLQEIRTSDAKFPVTAIEDAGYGAIWHGQRAHHGVAVLAKGDRRSRFGGVYLGIPRTRRRATSRRELGVSSSHRSISRTAIRCRRRISTTSFAGSSGSLRTRKNSANPPRVMCSPETSTSSRPISISTTPTGGASTQ